ncbi:MAG: HAMP domain-containing protein [Chloroflexi bacterium]|nr:HAMP domain-containing protein [Chloroflexota bacterium]
MRDNPQLNPASRLFAAVLSLPLRLKITIPYIIVVLLLAGVATWLVSQAFARTLQDQFRGQLVDGFTVASDAVFQTEADQLANVRAVGRTAGVAEAVAQRDSAKLNELIRPIVANYPSLTIVHILDIDGKAIYSLRADDNNNFVTGETTDFKSWEPVQRVLAGETDALGDKFVGVVEAPWGAVVYTVRPVKDGDTVIGAVLAGTPLDDLLAKMSSDPDAKVTIFKRDGKAVATTFDDVFQMPALTPETVEAVAEGKLSRLQNRLFEVPGEEYNEVLGALALRGQPSGWMIGVALPRSLIAQNSQFSPTELAIWFMMGILAIIGLGVVVAQIISVPVFELVHASELVAEGHLDVQVKEHTDDEFGLLARYFNRMIRELRQREIMNELSGKIASKEVRDALLAGRVDLAGEQKFVVLLSVDIRNFATLSEYYGPQEVVNFLNNYSTLVINAVREQGGTVSRLNGDSILSAFGAPITTEPGDSARRAIQTATIIRARLAELNARRIDSGQIPVKVDMSLHAGEVVAGNVGAADRADYTLVGDAAKDIAHIQASANKVEDSNILTSEAVIDLLDDKNWVITAEHGEVYLGDNKSLVARKIIGTRAALESVEGWVGSNRSLDVVEALYLYCRGFGLTTIARLKGVSQTEVRRWTEQAARQFETISETLGSEFGLTQNELQRLTKSLSQVPV